ncbi:hypothetical protein Ddc_13035 [Ditylenchus destructor]|nr:hypothetical protein Ddc_13035 [Ditylenchus destructor]
MHVLTNPISQFDLNNFIYNKTSKLFATITMGDTNGKKDQDFSPLSSSSDGEITDTEPPAMNVSKQGTSKSPNGSKKVGQAKSPKTRSNSFKYMQKYLDLEAKEVGRNNKKDKKRRPYTIPLKRQRGDSPVSYRSPLYRLQEPPSHFNTQPSTSRAGNLDIRLRRQNMEQNQNLLDQVLGFLENLCDFIRRNRKSR